MSARAVRKLLEAGSFEILVRAIRQEREGVAFPIGARKLTVARRRSGGEEVT